MDIEDEGLTSEEEMCSSDDDISFDGEFSFIYTFILSLRTQELVDSVRQKLDLAELLF